MKAMFDGLIYVAIMIPGIVIGIATLVALVTVFDLLNPILSSLWPEGVKAPKLSLGYASVIAAHTLFTMSLVIVLVRARIAGMDRASSRRRKICTHRHGGHSCRLPCHSYFRRFSPVFC